MGLIIKIPLASLMAKEDVAEAKPMELFPLEFPIFSEGMTGLTKDWNLYISGAEPHNCPLHLTTKTIGFPLAYCLSGCDLLPGFSPSLHMFCFLLPSLDCVCACLCL